MAVYGIEGTPGSGKTLYIISHFIVPFLKRYDDKGELRPKHIYHNIKGLNAERLAAAMDVPTAAIEGYLHVFGEVVNEETGEITEDKEQVKFFWKYLPRGAVAIIDETQLYFNSRDFKERNSREVIDYLTYHRHYGNTVIWITPNLEFIDQAFRRCTQYTYKIERLEKWGLKKSSVIKMFDECETENVRPYAIKTFNFPKKFFGCYESYEADALATGKEERPVTNAILNNKPIMIVGTILILLVILIFVNGNPFTKSTEILNKKQKPKTLNTTPHQEPPPPTLQGLQPEGGAVGGFSQLCYTQTYVNNYIRYYILNNGTTTTAGGYNVCN